MQSMEQGCCTTFKVPRFNKAQLAAALGLASAGGSVYYTRMRIEVFTDEVMSAVGLSEEMYERMRIWPLPVRQRIMVHLNLLPEDFE